MKPINEDEAEILIEEHLRSRGWDVTDFTVSRKSAGVTTSMGKKSTAFFCYEGKPPAILALNNHRL